MHNKLAFFVSDLHGKMSRYETLLKEILEQKPAVVLIGGDLLPHAAVSGPGKLSADDFAEDYLPKKFRKLRDQMAADYPMVMLIMGNDDPRAIEPVFLEHDEKGLWKYLHMRKLDYLGYSFYGYSMVPPTPFQLKDWERYDVSRYTDPGCTAPDEGFRTVKPDVDIERTTIVKELNELTGDADLSSSVFLFHSPPYQCKLDRAALDGRMYEHVPLDVHVGSIAIQRFIEDRQPMLTLHGHIHESTRLTDAWQEHFGNTLSFNAAHDGPELSLIRFDLDRPGEAVRLLV
jgi:Icc-related predicted phosphoesterase